MHLRYTYTSETPQIHLRYTSDTPQIRLRYIKHKYKHTHTHKHTLLRRFHSLRDTEKGCFGLRICPKAEPNKIPVVYRRLYKRIFGPLFHRRIGQFVFNHYYRWQDVLHFGPSFHHCVGQSVINHYFLWEHVPHFVPLFHCHVGQSIINHYYLWEVVSHFGPSFYRCNYGKEKKVSYFNSFLRPHFIDLL